jgi:hypothetical protein
MMLDKARYVERWRSRWNWYVLRAVLLSPFAFLLLCLVLGIDGSHARAVR